MRGGPIPVEKNKSKKIQGSELKYQKGATDFIKYDLLGGIQTPISRYTDKRWKQYSIHQGFTNYPLSTRTTREEKNAVQGSQNAFLFGGLDQTLKSGNRRISPFSKVKSQNQKENFHQTREMISPEFQSSLERLMMYPTEETYYTTKLRTTKSRSGTKSDSHISKNKKKKRSAVLKLKKSLLSKLKKSSSITQLNLQEDYPKSFQNEQIASKQKRKSTSIYITKNMISKYSVEGSPSKEKRKKKKKGASEQRL